MLTAPHHAKGRASRPCFRMGKNSSDGTDARVETSGGIQASLGGRYAMALFELARDEKQIDAVSASLSTLNQAVAGSDDFRRLVTSPLVNRGDAVTHRQHGADFRNLRFGAEIGDLVADDLRDFCGADIHVQPFIACASMFNLVRIDPSTWREPSLTMRPPRMSLSTVVSIETSLPVCAFSFALSVSS